MNIYLIRHGDDDENYRGGWSELPLIPEGVKKCTMLAEYMCNNNQEFSFKKIISSDLKRAIMTSDIICSKNNIELKLDERLREINNGDIAGMLNSEVFEKYPGLYFSSLEYNEKYPNGESPEEFFFRIKNAFEDIVRKNNKEDIAIVTHGGVISIIWHIINNIEWSNKNKSPRVDKTSIWKITKEDYNMHFQYENYCPHLEKKDSV